MSMRWPTTSIEPTLPHRLPGVLRLWQGPGRMVRRRVPLPAALVLALVPVTASAQAPSPPLHDADYWAFVEHAFTAMDDWWSPREQLYIAPGRSTPEIRLNAGMLAIHAIAALEGRAGLARSDARARALIGRLTSPPVARRGIRATGAWPTVSWAATLAAVVADLRAGGSVRLDGPGAARVRLGA